MCNTKCATEGVCEVCPRCVAQGVVRALWVARARVCQAPAWVCASVGRTVCAVRVGLVVLPKSFVASLVVVAAS